METAFEAAMRQRMLIPDLWQQEALRHLRAGRDVVVNAPTGSGKTLVFELMVGGMRGRAVYTVPTRALANDKFAEWAAKGWDVGIETGDVVERPNARIVVATLETQRRRLLTGNGPDLLVVDEYQMLADPVRGSTYELAVASAPAGTRLLLLSGSVGNGVAVVEWLRRIGRDAVLIDHAVRPVPLEEVELGRLQARVPESVRGWWCRAMAAALMNDLGPVLIFAPKRYAAEVLARQLAAGLPPGPGVRLEVEQERMVGSQLAGLLRRGVAYHHSGLSYAVRSKVVEPLAKQGKLRVVVATMGLASGVNFSLRSVVISGTRYYRGPFEVEVRPDEILQMYGRAGRRGLDTTGYALVTDSSPRLGDGRPRVLRRAGKLDWPSLISVMDGAVERGESPFGAVAALNARLFAKDAPLIGVEGAERAGAAGCGLGIDAARVRFLRRGATRVWVGGSEGWVGVDSGAAGERCSVNLDRLWVWSGDETRGRWVRALRHSGFMAQRIGAGMTRVGGEAWEYGLRCVLGRRIAGGVFELAPSVRKLLGLRSLTLEGLERFLGALPPELLRGGKRLAVSAEGDLLTLEVGFSSMKAEGVRVGDRFLFEPRLEREQPEPCRACVNRLSCESGSAESSPAMSWLELGLIDGAGRPTRRGRVFSFFQNGEGLAVAAALEDLDYPVEDIVFDLANVRAGVRFNDPEGGPGGRLAVLCQRTYRHAECEGYLSMGLPGDYGDGGGEVVRRVVVERGGLQHFLREDIGMGDLERVVTEWRSLMRQIAFAPELDWERWMELRRRAQALSSLCAK
jgi:superfamily II DNA/RNA helicase